MFEVQNQPPPLEDYNLLQTDAALREAVRREGADWAESRLNALGSELGTLTPSRSASPPTATRRSSRPSTATATASTRLSSIRPGTR